MLTALQDPYLPNPFTADDNAAEPFPEDKLWLDECAQGCGGTIHPGAAKYESQLAERNAQIAKLQAKLTEKESLIGKLQSERSPTVPSYMADEVRHLRDENNRAHNAIADLQCRLRAAHNQLDHYRLNDTTGMGMLIGGNRSGKTTAVEQSRRDHADLQRRLEYEDMQRRLIQKQCLVTPPISPGQPPNSALYPMDRPINYTNGALGLDSGSLYTQQARMEEDRMKQYEAAFTRAKMDTTGIQIALGAAANLQQCKDADRFPDGSKI